MKKLVAVTVAVLVFLSAASAGYALDTTLLTTRNKIFDESKLLRAQLATSQDVMLLSSLFDSCLLTTSQLDAYFTMLGIFNSIRREDISPVPLDHLTRWLVEIKTTNNLTIKNLESSLGATIEPANQTTLEKFRDYFVKLNNQIDVDLAKIALMKKAAKR